MNKYLVELETLNGVRSNYFWADDEEHAKEQFLDALRGELFVSVVEGKPERLFTISYQHRDGRTHSCRGQFSKEQALEICADIKLDLHVENAWIVPVETDEEKLLKAEHGVGKVQYDGPLLP